jgi:hypothetical protein
VLGDIDWPAGTLDNRGGIHQVNSLTIIAGGAYRLQDNGVLSARMVRLNPGGQLLLLGGTFQDNQSITLDNGSLQIQGTRELGVLILTNSAVSTINLTAGTAATVHFLDSRAAGWEPNSRLEIWYWSGTVNGGTTHRIYVGANLQGLSAVQLRQIVFRSPAGFPNGVFQARILSTGELAPALPPTLNHVSLGGRLVLNWPEGYDLYSSTNVNGPYQFVTHSVPYTNLYNGPQRFFYLRSQ